MTNTTMVKLKYKIKKNPQNKNVKGDAEEAMSGPQNKHLRIENKNFYFDIKKNQQGRYMSISEVKGNYRNSILIPESGWENFRDVLDDYVKQVTLGMLKLKVITNASELKLYIINESYITCFLDILRL